MASKRFLTLLLLATLCLFVPRPVAATAIANSVLNFSNLTITPATGSLTFDDVWLLQGFASANNSLGGSDAQFNFAFSPGMTAATAAVTWATASGTATALDDPPNLNVSGGAISGVNVPGCGAFAAFSEGTGTLSNSFTISGTGSVAVQFAVNIAGMLNAMTDGCGLNAFTQTTFTLAVDGGAPILFDLQASTIGPSSSLAQSFSELLTDTVFLDAGVSHFLILQADSESQGQTQVPEPPSSALLLLGVAVLLWSRRRA